MRFHLFDSKTKKCLSLFLKLEAVAHTMIIMSTGQEDGRTTASPPVVSNHHFEAGLAGRLAGPERRCSAVIIQFLYKTKNHDRRFEALELGFWPSWSSGSVIVW